MDSEKVQRFMQIADQTWATRFGTGSEEERKLGAQLLLSEVLEYVVHGLGVVPVVNGTEIREPNDLEYGAVETPDKKEMLDGLADVAYTMYWNAVKFHVPLEEAYELVCDNNLSKFVLLEDWKEQAGPVEKGDWDFNMGVEWPESVATVEVVKVSDTFYGVGKDKTGKVRKPSTYRSVDLQEIVDRS